jgi:hypothetical protein
VRRMLFSRCVLTLPCSLPNPPPLLSRPALLLGMGSGQFPAAMGSLLLLRSLLPLQLSVLPPVHELQQGEDTRWRWVLYSAYDAKSTWALYQRLKEELQASVGRSCGQAGGSSVGVHHVRAWHGGSWVGRSHAESSTSSISD